MSWVFRNSKAELGDRLVLLAIADFADDNGFCWPSVAKIAEKTLMSERAVQYSIRALVSLGELAASIGTGELHKNEYTVLLGCKDCTLSSESKGANSDVFHSPLLKEPSGNHQKEETSKEPPLPPLSPALQKIQDSFDRKNQARENRGARGRGGWRQAPAKYPPIQRGERQVRDEKPPEYETPLREILRAIAKDVGCRVQGSGLAEWVWKDLEGIWVLDQAGLRERAIKIMQQTADAGLSWIAGVSALHRSEKARGWKGSSLVSADPFAAFLAGGKETPNGR